MTTILIITTIQAWFFLTLIISTKKLKQSFDYLLATWLFVIGLHTLIYYLMYSSNSINVYGAIINAAIPFLQGPFLFLYVRTKSLYKIRLSLIDAVHFIPFFAFIIFQIINSKVLSGKPSDDQHHVYIGFFQDFNAFGIFFLLSLPIYIGLSYWVSKKARSLNPDKSIWIKMLILFVAGIWISSILSLLVPALINHTLQVGFNSLIFISLTGFVYLISYFGFKQNIFSTDIPKIGTIKYSKSKILEDEAELIWLNLNQHLKTKKPYLDPDINLNQLSSQMGITTHKLSQIINAKSNLSFNDLINKQRIDEVKNMMKSNENKNLSLLGMALEAGFNSKATFNRAFKKFENCTPSEYMKQHSS
ncbi:helix-turn-helix domain-containing protein [Flavobacteriaceae bacterium S0862]|nr:helix-turn-helix domain-containing protein [Flavobacteriaceae bacterium S0862]